MEILSIVSLIMITIREISARDAPEIMLLSHQLGYSISEQQTLENITAVKESKHHTAFVAIQEQQIIGWIGVSYNISLESPPLCEVRGLVVHEQFRGVGAGKMLVEKAKEWSRENGAGKLRVRCNVKRTESLLFYHGAGFTEVKQQQVFEIRLNA